MILDHKKTQQPLDLEAIRKDFPILHQRVQGKPLIYLDNSASSQKPNCVIDAITQYYRQDHANIHRGVYELSQRATRAYEQARERIRQFIHAKSLEEIIFVRGATEAINLVAQSFLQSAEKECSQQPDAAIEVIISTMEHHSNIVPWQLIAGCQLRVIPITDSGEIDLDAYQKLFNDKTKLVAISHASNVLGTINPIKQMIDIAHKQGVAVLVDGAQAFPHLTVDVQALDCDFYVFSAHKAYGPTGVGVLYGKKSHLEKMPPFQGGGDMIEQVYFEKSTFNKLPFKFEAGTPNIAGVIGFGAAIDYLQSVGMSAIMQHEKQLLAYATEKLLQQPEVRIIGTAKDKLGVISFTFADVHPHDIATIFDHEGIAVRAGHHCAMPLMKRYNVPATTRVSFGIYNTIAEIDAVICALHKVAKMFL